MKVLYQKLNPDFSNTTVNNFYVTDENFSHLVFLEDYDRKQACVNLMVRYDHCKNKICLADDKEVEEFFKAFKNNPICFRTERIFGVPNINPNFYFNGPILYIGNPKENWRLRDTVYLKNDPDLIRDLRDKIEGQRLFLVTENLSTPDLENYFNFYLKTIDILLKVLKKDGKSNI